MNRFNLRLVARNTPGSLERILNTSRVRGFAINHFEAELDSEQHYAIEMAVSSERNIEQLVLQLTKQFDIRELEQRRCRDAV
ncbi:acetolactate synthase 2 small subunit [Aestuariirhabdus sp. Z084]|uniref:acetolactate synthase 2 small subunit n=1 Tax=Aestuariirhabdus haliotis TaxID=2918751 RepID=UPI00201B3E51|nr:acetolactate synthase 2 small subunit [Aestuariirhabdus haliotis]MCL6415463.1 acetolactate synthase 2 small subunit [Aestuariirhabdus haliotis]MCL6419332.1 acetolactate synthase 2 small subunit [Aestuariirhabdus haliotis]